MVSLSFPLLLLDYDFAFMESFYLFHVSLSCRFSFSLECEKKQTVEGARWKGVILGNMYVTLSNNSAIHISVHVSVEM